MFGTAKSSIRANAEAGKPGDLLNFSAGDDAEVLALGSNEETGNTAGAHKTPGANISSHNQEEDENYRDGEPQVVDVTDDFEDRPASKAKGKKSTEKDTTDGRQESFFDNRDQFLSVNEFD